MRKWTSASIILILVFSVFFVIFSFPVHGVPVKCQENCLFAATGNFYYETNLPTVKNYWLLTAPSIYFGLNMSNNNLSAFANSLSNNTQVDIEGIYNPTASCATGLCSGMTIQVTQMQFHSSNGFTYYGNFTVSNGQYYLVFLNTNVNPPSNYYYSLEFPNAPAWWDGSICSSVNGVSCVHIINGESVWVTGNLTNAIGLSCVQSLGCNYGTIAVQGIEENSTTSTIITTTSSTQFTNWNEWQAYVSRIPTPGPGCWNITYPSIVWQQVPCGPAPNGTEFITTNSTFTPLASPLGDNWRNGYYSGLIFIGIVIVVVLSIISYFILRKKSR